MSRKPLRVSMGKLLSRPALGVLVITVSWLLAASLVAANEAKSAPPNQPAAANAPQPGPTGKTYALDEPHPTITFEATEHYYGESSQDQDLAYDFKFKNTGRKELEIMNVKGG